MLAFVLTCLCSLSQWLNVRIRESNKSQLEGCSFLVFHSMFFFLYFSLAETSSLSGVLVVFSRCANKHAIFFPHFVWCMHVPQVVMPGSMICNVTFLVTCFTCLASSWTFFESFCSVSFNFVFVPDRLLIFPWFSSASLNSLRLAWLSIIAQTQPSQFTVLGLTF